jgi:hypothetical protein
MSKDSRTTLKLPRGWKILTIEAWNGKQKIGIDYEISKGATPERAVKEIIEMVGNFK